MSIATYDAAPAETPERPAARKGLFARALDALIAAQTRRAADEIARHRRFLPDAAEWLPRDRAAR